MCNMLLICNYLTTARERALCVGKTEKHHCPLGDKDKPRAARPLETASPKKKSRELTVPRPCYKPGSSEHFKYGNPFYSHNKSVR